MPFNADEEGKKCFVFVFLWKLSFLGFLFSFAVRTHTFSALLFAVHVIMAFALHFYLPALRRART